METTDYYRLNYTDERYLSDYTKNKYALSDEEINTLINDKESDVVGAMSDTVNYPMFADWYSWMPEPYLEQLYQHILRTPNYGYIVFFLDHPIDGYRWGVELLVAILEAYSVRDYQEEVEGGGDLHLLPKQLSRTVSTQTIKDMTLSFESERLGIKIDTPFEQFLSTVPNGIEIIEKYKAFKASIPSAGIV